MDVSLLALACALCWVPVGDHSSEHAQASKTGRAVSIWPIEEIEAQRK